MPARGSAAADSGSEPLLDLAAQLEPDGGMPGASLSERAARTVSAVFAFVSAGHTINSGAFRSHVVRMAAFLQSLTAISGSERRIVDAACAAAAGGPVPPAAWLALASAPRVEWPQIAHALQIA